MAGPAGARSGATTNVQTSTKLYRRQQAPPTRRYLNDGAAGTLAAPTGVDTRVDPTRLRISRESNVLGSTLPPREPVKRRTSRIAALRPRPLRTVPTQCLRRELDLAPRISISTGYSIPMESHSTITPKGCFESPRIASYQVTLKSPIDHNRKLLFHTPPTTFIVRHRSTRPNLVSAAIGPNEEVQSWMWCQTYPTAFFSCRFHGFMRPRKSNQLNFPSACICCRKINLQDE